MLATYKIIPSTADWVPSFSTLTSQAQARHLSMSLVDKTRHGHVPAAIVSPARRISTRPISLLSLAVSSGIVGGLPAFWVDRSVISTVAVTPFCSTLQVSLHSDPEHRAELTSASAW